MTSVKLSPALADRLSELCERFAARTGERPVDVRRGVEITALLRGIEAIERELDEAELAERNHVPDLVRVSHIG